MITYRSPIITSTVNLLIFFFGALILTIKSGYTYAPTGLLLFALPILFVKKTYSLTPNQRFFICTLLSYIVILIISHLRDSGLNGHHLEPPMRILASVFVFLLLYQIRLSFNAIIYGFLAGSFIAGGLAIYEKLILGSERAFSFIDRSYVIQAGDISMSLAFVCLTATIYFYRKQLWLQMGLFMAGSLSGIIASLLSGTRGGWIFFPVILIALYSLYRSLLTKKAKLIGFALLTAIALLCTVPQMGVTTRIHQAMNDITLFSEGKNKNTSLGVRFQLWHSAWLSFKERPIFGWGDENLDNSKQAQLKTGVISQHIYQSRFHAHNEFLDEMAKRGVIGLLALLAIFAVPFMLFKKAFYRTSNLKIQTIASAGMMIILSTIDFCFSQAFLKHNSGIMYYFFALVILMAYCYPKIPSESEIIENPEA